MDSFFGLLVAIVSLMTVITLSIMELWVVPWPILLILLLLTLWISQRLIDRFNPAPAEGLTSVSADPSTEFSTPADSDHPIDPIALRYRGQPYEETSSHSPPQSNLAEDAVTGDRTVHQCYRGIPVQSPVAEDPDREHQPSPSANPKLSSQSSSKLSSNLSSKLSYRGIKRS